jgi:hypothetical protein
MSDIKKVKEKILDDLEHPDKANSVRYWVLDDDHNAVPADLLTWADWFEKDFKKRFVKRDVMPDGRAISTVFLGIDLNWSGGPPLIFETMVFKADTSSEEYCERCSTWSQALKQHDDALDWAIAHPDGENDL